VELRHLRYFVAVADELNFRRAAARLRISQPPLSQQIRRLEDELGVPLFRRTRRLVELTAGGRALLERARPLLEEVERLPALVARAARGETGVLTLGFVASSSYALLPAILRAFRDERPAGGARVPVDRRGPPQTARPSPGDRDRAVAGRAVRGRAPTRPPPGSQADDPRP
jgi:DNA-binding transcriptional LysR family regulator